MTIKHFKFSKFDVLAISIIILSSFILLLDATIYKGQPANMDGTAHIVNIAAFHKALSSGDFPVRWVDGFANYGLPMGSFAQQFTSYAGAFLTFLTHDVLVSFNFVYVIGTISSVVLFYLFLRFYFDSWPSFVGAFLFNFAPYRIINFYIRGAIPEYFSSVFFVLILICLYLFIKKKFKWAYIGLALSVFGMILSHPMNVVTSSVFIGPYLIYLILGEKNKLKTLISVSSSIFLGVLLSSYYLVPLLRDIKYFYYGSSVNHYNPTHLDLESFFNPNWYYFLTERNEILSRGHFIKTGLIESILMILGTLVVIIKRGLKKQISFIDVAILSGLLSVFLTTKYSSFLYQNINILSNIQFPWRMLSTLIFVPPIIASYLLVKIKNKYLSYILSIILITAIAWNRFPQIYGKNFTIIPQENYYFTVENIHSSNMNTIWTANTDDYQVHKNDKVAILEGEANLTDVSIMNSKRSFNIDSSAPVRMIDYTFYFPGWKVFVDGAEVPIEFQDVENKGVITYWVPEGKHTVEVIFTNTKTVLAGNYLSLFGLMAIGFMSLILSRPKKV